MEKCIKNIKISIKISTDICAREKSREKIFKYIDNFHIIIYKHTPNLVNLTGIRSLDQIPKAISSVEELFQTKSISYKINCIMLSIKKFKKIIKLEKIPPILQLLDSEYTFDFNQEIFSGGFLKREDFPTIILFHTASFQIFATDIEKMHYSYNMMNMLLERYFQKQYPPLPPPLKDFSTSGLVGNGV